MKQSFIKLCLLLMSLCLLVGALAMGAAAAETADSGVEFLYQQLTLADDLIMNFEIAIEETVAKQATVDLTVDGAVTSYTVSQMTANERGNYSFSVEVAAAQMTETIHVAVTVDGSVIAERDYTVRAYADALLNGSYGDEVEDLVKKMLNYGAKAQTYFQYNTDAPADADIGDITLAEVPSVPMTYSVEGTVPGISYAGNSMVFTGKLTIRYYFNAPAGVDGYTFTANGNSYKAEKKNGMYYVDVVGINPQNIDQSIVMTVSDGSNSLSVDYSPMHYITRMYNKDSVGTSLKDLLQALYSYHLAAKTYITKTTDSLSVSEAIALKGKGTAAYINGYVAGWSVSGTRKAIILQDTVTGECIEFWGSDSSDYNDIWSSYAVGDHVTVYTPAIVDNKGLPRADKTVIPVMTNGSYKLSTGNKIKVTEITNFTTFLNSVYSDGKNTLGVYSCEVTVLNTDYLHRIETKTGTLSIQLKDSVVTPTLEVGKTYTMQFVLTGYSSALTSTGNQYVRVSVMDAADVAGGESINNLSVSEAIALKGKGTAAYINGYVAGWSVDGTTRKAIILQDTETGECIEFWASDSSAYHDVWNTYNVGDHVTIYASSIVDNKGLPRAQKTVKPIQINGTYKLSTGNEIQVTKITDMTAFLNSVYSDGKNTLGVYSCTVTALDSNYLHRIETSTGTLSIQLYQSVVAPTLEVNNTYTMQFVLTGYSNALTTSGNQYVRVSVMDAANVTEDTSMSLVSVSEAVALKGKGTAAYIHGYVAGWSINGTTRKAMILQDTATGECIEFWADNASSYAETWNSYAVGDHVVIHADAIVDNKGLPRAGSGTNTVQPVKINGSYKISTGNELQVTKITDMNAFLNSTYTGKNVLGVYTCTVKIANSNYLHQITPSSGNNLRIQLKDSVVTPDLTVGDWYTMKFVVTGYSNTLTTTGNVYVRVSVMEAADAANVGMSVSEAIKLMGKDTAAQIHGYVAGWSVDGSRKAIILQDTATGECIEFWGSNSSEYNSVWNKYAVGDHVSIEAASIVDNKGLPRAEATVTPIEINGSYILSSGNEIQVTKVTNMTTFLNSVYADGANTLGAYSCTVTVSDPDYLHRINTSGGTLSIQLYQSAAAPALTVGKTYSLQFVLTGYDKALTNSGERYVRVSVMDAEDVTEDPSLTLVSVSEAIDMMGSNTEAYIHGYVAGWSIKSGIRKAILLQDTVTGECIEFWGNDSSTYNDTWNAYEVGDHVAIRANAIVSNRGLPRAGSGANSVTPIRVNGADKLSTGNELQVTRITNMNTFLINAYEGANALGVYSCNITKANESDLYDFISGTGHLRVRLYESAANPELTVGKMYAMQFVVTGYSAAMKTEGDVVVRLSLMDASDAVIANQADIEIGAMSFNMKYEDPAGTTETTHTWANRKAGVAQCINTYLPDVIGTQELRGWQYEELMNLLGSSWKGVGLSRNGGDSERCSIIYNSRTVEYVSGETIWLSETPTIQGSTSWDSAQPRILTYGKFRHKETNTEFYVFNTHLDHKSTTARANQLAMIVSYMNKYVGSYPVILTGDFNMYISDEGFSSLVDKSDVYDHTFTPFVDKLGKNMKTTHGFNGGTSGSPIDFIFYSKANIQVESTQIIHDMYKDTYYLSDHYPVYSVLTLNPIHTSE